MSIADDQALLAKVNTAISNIVEGEVMAKGSESHSVTKLNLDQLMKMRSDLETRIARAQQGSFAVARFTNLR